MKRIYNNMLDRESLTRDTEGLRVYNNKLYIIQRLHKLDRSSLLKKIRATK